MITYAINQSEMTSECWPIQWEGLAACENCEFKGKRDCGGKKIRRTLTNSKGYIVPLGRGNGRANDHE